MNQTLEIALHRQDMNSVAFLEYLSASKIVDCHKDANSNESALDPFTAQTTTHIAGNTPC